MKYKALLLILSLLLQGILFGQNTQAFKYQAVARDASGYPITNQDVSLQIQISSNLGNTEIEYVENHYVTTNDFGLINIEVGNGEVVQGNFQSINWENGNKFIEISIDPNGGNDFIFMGSSEILSVPKANYAEKAGNGGDTSLYNEFQRLRLTESNMLHLDPSINPSQVGIDLNQFEESADIDSLGQKVLEDSTFFGNEISNLNQTILNETNRAMAAENNLYELIDQNALHIVSDSIYFQNLINTLNAGGNDDSLYFQTLIDNNTLRIINDSAYLKSLIDANNLAIQQEVTRAILAEAINATNISANSNLIADIQSELLSDSTYLKNLIDQNSNAITAEITRAISAELQNSNNIAQNSNNILENANSILNDSIYFKNLTDQIDFFLQEEITRATYRDETMSDSIVYLYAKQESDSTYFQNLINGLSGGGLDPTLENGKIFVGNTSNIATGVYLSGDAQLTNTGVMLINPNAITTSKIANGNVTNAKLASSYFSISDDNGNSGQINLGSGLNIEAIGAANVNYNDATKKLSISSSDNQILNVSGNNLSISAGNSVDLSAIVGQMGPQGPQGPAGNDGVGVLSTINNGNGTFTINYTDGSSFTSADLTGPQGAQGPVGPQGIQGPAGADGSDGLNGSDGVGIQSTVDNGDGTFTITYTDGSTFTSADLTGPQGIQGIQGPQGPVGPQGAIGPAGPQGVTGNDGISINWYGTVFPAPSSPSLNDGYHDPVQNKSFIWNGSVWLTISEDGIQGPQGPTGPQGPAGTSLRDCPSTGSWSQINEEYCIEVNENTSDTWWNAAKYCGDQNAHLCSWQEWYYVCQKSGSGTINMTNDWEWTGDGQTGSPSTATVVGNGSCNGSSSESMNNSKTFRCCFSR